MKPIVQEHPESRRIDGIAIFAALSIFLSIIELLIPKPIPFFRIGLANLPLLVALTLFSRRDFTLLVLLKVLGQAVVSGTLFSYVFLFSAVGSLSAAAAMLLLRPLYPSKISLVGIGVMGALGSNIAQLLFAAGFIFGSGTRLIAPLFLLVGTITGSILGWTAQTVLKRSDWLHFFQQNPDLFSDVLSEETPEYSGRNAHNGGAEANRAVERRSIGHRQAWFRLAVGLLMIPPLIMQPVIWLKLLHISGILLYSLQLGKRIRLLPGFLILTAVTFAALLSPLGEVIVSVGTFPVTAGALQQGLHRGLNLIALVYISRASVSSDLQFPGKTGQLLYRVFFYFEEFSSIRLEKGQKKGLIRNLREKLSELDRLLLDFSQGHGLQKGGDRRGSSDSVRNTTFWSVFFLFVQWLLYFFQKIAM